MADAEDPKVEEEQPKDEEFEDEPTFLKVKNVVRRVQTRLQRVRMPGRARFKQYIGDRRILRGQHTMIDMDMAALLAADLAWKMEAGIVEIYLEDKKLSVDAFQDMVEEHTGEEPDVVEGLVAMPEPGGLRPRESTKAQAVQDSKVTADQDEVEAKAAAAKAAKAAEEKEAAEVAAKLKKEAEEEAEAKAVEEAEAKAAAEEKAKKAEESKAARKPARKPPTRRAPKTTEEK